MTDPTKALTLHQPYASLIAEGVKRIETLSWRTRYQGWLAIHAGRRLYTAADKHADPGLFFAAHDALELERSGGVYGLPYGAVVAVAQLTDCVPIVDLGAESAVRRVENGGHALWLSEPEVEQNPGQEDTRDITDQLPYGDYSEGRWAWLLSDIHRIPEPIPAKGRQGLWRPDEDLTAAIRKQMPEVTRG